MEEIRTNENRWRFRDEKINSRLYRFSIKEFNFEYFIVRFSLDGSIDGVSSTRSMYHKVRLVVIDLFIVRQREFLKSLI